jgi:hypothetical protein
MVGLGWQMGPSQCGVVEWTTANLTQALAASRRGGIQEPFLPACLSACRAIVLSLKARLLPMLSVGLSRRLTTTADSLAAFFEWNTPSPTRSCHPPPDEVGRCFLLEVTSRANGIRRSKGEQPLAASILGRTLAPPPDPAHRALLTAGTARKAVWKH